MDKRRGLCITILCQSLCLRVPKFFVGQIFCVSEKIGYRKKLRIIRGLHYYLLILFCSTVPKNFVRKHFGISENFCFRNFFFDERLGGLSRFFFHSTEEIRRGTLLCSKKIWYRKNLRIIGGLHYYLLMFFCTTVPKNFVRKHFGVSGKFWFRKFFFDERRAGCITIFFQSRCLAVPKNFVRKPFFVSENFGYRKKLWIREEGGASQFFVKVCVSQSRKNSYGNPSLFQKKSAVEKTYGY